MKNFDKKNYKILICVWKSNVLVNSNALIDSLV